MSVIDQLLDELRRRDVRLWADGGHLHYDAPRGALTDALVAALRLHKATVLDRLTAARPPAATPLCVEEGDRPLLLSFAQERMWLLWKLAPGSPAYHIPLLLKLTGPLDLEALLDALHGLARRHEILRSRFAGGRTA